MKDQWIPLKSFERSRTYLYSDNQKITFKDVTALYVSSSGTHYLEYEGEKKAIVMPGYRAILLDMDKWTYPKHEE